MHWYTDMHSWWCRVVLFCFVSYYTCISVKWNGVPKLMSAPFHPNFTPAGTDLSWIRPPEDKKPWELPLSPQMIG